MVSTVIKAITDVLRTLIRDYGRHFGFTNSPRRPVDHKDAAERCLVNLHWYPSQLCGDSQLEVSVSSGMEVSISTNSPISGEEIVSRL